MDSNHSKPLLGLCPIGKFVFSNEDALKYKQQLQALLKKWDVRYVDLEGIVPDGLVKDQSHVEPVVNYFTSQKIDALFMPHCNFGTEGAVGMIARRLGVPVLLWGPRDEAPLPDGTRLRDTLCGLFASSKVLRKLNVPFTYIENCRIEDAAFERCVDTFLRAVNVAKIFRQGARIGMIGQRIDFFWTTIINESDLLTRFNIEILPIEMSDFIAAAHARASRAQREYQAEVDQLCSVYKVIGLEDEPFRNVLAVRDEMLALAQDRKLDGISFQSFMAIVDAMGAYCFYAESQVAEKVAFALENDVHGVISDLILRRAQYGAAPVHLAEFTVRHPENENGVLFWHAGAPLSMRHPESEVEIGHHWILPSPLSGMPHFRMKDGPMTVCRFDGEGSEYKIAFGEMKTIDGPYTRNSYAWVEVDDWPRWERILIEGPFIHHLAMTYGYFADVLEEATRYIPRLQPVRLG